MKIILVRPRYKSYLVTPPLGIGYLSSYLKKHGIETKLIDGLKSNLSNSQIVKKIVSEKPDAVGITCLTAFYNKAVNLSRLIKKNNITTIIGGIHPTFLPHQTLRDSNTDYVICGEGEIALLKLAQNNFVNNKIQGIYSIKDFKGSKSIIKKAEMINELDSLPFPDWKQMNPRHYPQAPHGATAKNFPIGVIVTTRGCPYECTFCAGSKFYDRKIRYRSPENVIKEIQYLIKKFGVREIHFEDDNLTFNKEHITKICQLIIKNNIKISWACPNGIRADKVDEGLLRLMKKSGCYYIAYGVESANPQILKNIKKHETIDVIKKSIEIANRVGIITQGFFVFGLPGETPETLEETIRFARRSKLTRAQFLILDILPGSELWSTLQGKFTPNWTKKSYKEPEWIPDGVTKKQLIDAQARAFRQFYLRPKTFFTIAKQIRPKQLPYLFRRMVEYRMLR